MRVLSNVVAYPRLLLAGNPSTRDILTLLLGFLSACVAGVPFPLIAIIFGQLLNAFNSATCNATDGSSDQGKINDKILIIVYLAIAQFVAIYCHLTCWALTGARLSQRLREQYLRNILRQEPSFFDNLPAGEVAARLNGDIKTIRSGTAEKVGICISSFSFFVTAYIVAFIKQPVLAGQLVSLVPAYFLMAFVGSYYIEKYSGIMSDHAASAASIASEALCNLTVVQAFGASKRLESKFAAELKASETAGLKKATAIGTQNGVLYFVAYSANALAFWQASRLIADSIQDGASGTTVGAAFTVVFVLIEASLMLSQISPFLHLLGAAIASHQKLCNDMHRKSLIDGSSTSGLSLKSVKGCFEFKNVSFVYPSRPDVPVLENFSLSIPAYKHTALVGLSGSGKSTIAGLVTRLYDPTQGQVLFEGNDLIDLNIRDLRGCVSLVQQEPCLLDRSLLENIAHGLINSRKANHTELSDVLLGTELAEIAKEVRGGGDLESTARSRGHLSSEIISQVVRAAKLADAHGFITGLHHGYGTVVGSAGRLISGGQKQRVSLARALIKDPTVLVLDEATASLDPKCEQRIQRAIAEVSNGRTLITIAHRLSTITNADNIVVMHKGVIREQGTHAELMKKNGAYADLVRMQSVVTKAEGRQTTATELYSPSQSDDTLAEDPAMSDGTSIDSGIRDPEKANFRTFQTHDINKEQQEIDGGCSEAAVKTPPKSIWSLVKGYSPALRPRLLVFLFALLAATVVGAAFSGEAVVFGNTVGDLSPCNSASYIRSRGALFGLMFFVLAIIEFFANVVSWTGFGWVSEKMVFDVRVLSFRSLFEQDLQWHQSERRTPTGLLSYITRDGDALAGLSGSVIGTLFSITVNLVAAVILTLIIAWKIALVCIALVPLMLGCGLLELRTLSQFEEKHEIAYTTSVGIGVEAVGSIKTIAALALEEETMRVYRRSLDGPRKDTMRATLLASFYQAMTYFLGNLVNALAYWWGSKQITNGNYTQTQFLIVVFSLLVGALLWSQMFALAPELTAARAAMARILSLIELGSEKMHGNVLVNSLHEDIPRDIEAMPRARPTSKPVASACSVELRDVKFSYPARPESLVLKGLDIVVRPGQFCALVGPSGAGKSTVISLIERLYIPESGSILIDGVDITLSRDTAFRSSIALVPQDSILFEGSISFNVGIGAPPDQEVTQSDIEEACKMANIHDVILGLPDGYQTRCGPNGNQFSGGQKQRLSIARALVRKPRLLILDESTSALDAESEKLLEDGLRKATRGITVVAIAHRLHTISRADVICMIEDGKCVDRGSHEELLERSASYRANVLAQTIAT